MTRQQILQDYQVKNGRIASPGKFEGEPIFAPYFWDLGLMGCADNDNGSVFLFQFAFNSSTDDQKIAEEFPELRQWLGRKRSLKLQEDSQGFIHCF